MSSMKTTIGKLRSKLGSESAYFQKVYNHTFDFALGPGQRSLRMRTLTFFIRTHSILIYCHLAIQTAQAFWATLIPHGVHGGALARDGDISDDDEGWKDEYTQWWFDFLNEKRGKGISKDTWVMVKKAEFFSCAIYGGTNNSFLVYRVCQGNWLQVRELWPWRWVMQQDNQNDLIFFN